jgi:hypothetical protein
MNEILLDMSRRQDNTFCSKIQFMAYFDKVLRYEKRDAEKTNNVNVPLGDIKSLAFQAKGR